MSLPKNLLATSAASAFMLMAAAPIAHAQVLDITDCADFVAGNVDNPGTADAGATVNIDTGGVNCVVSNGDHIDLEDGDQDDITINIAAGSRLTNVDTSDEDTVVFIDNSENATTINIADGASIAGTNGVIFIEGDGTTINNSGDIIGTAAQEEGTIYVDRDTDGDLILINNLSTGRILAQNDGPAIGIEVLLADGLDDPEDVNVQSPLADFPTISIINEAGGLIQAGGLASDDTDAINIAGSPGTTGGLARACFEMAAVNCQVNLRVVNSGIIRSQVDNSGNAGITFEDDAVFNGNIVNRAGGLITGSRNGIRIGDAFVAGEGGADHTGRVINQGSITGTLASSRGIDLEGDGVRISNGATGVISGLSVGIEVGAGTSSGDAHSGERNSIANRGTISGSNYAIDSTNADGRIRIVNFGGGVLDGNVRGSLGAVDLLTFRGGASSLTHDVLQGFAVSVTPDANLTFVGSRTIEGSLISRGTSTFDIGDTQTVTGRTQFTAGSTIALTDLGNVGAIGQQFTLVEAGGELINLATLDDSDSSLLLDFDFVEDSVGRDFMMGTRDLIVEAFAAGAGTPTAKATAVANQISFSSAATEDFGTQILTAFNDGGLDGTDAFSGLGVLSTASAVGTTLEGLTPDFGLVQNVFNTVESNSETINNRLNNLNCNQYDGEKSCLADADSGVWFQKSSPYGGQNSLDLNSTSLSFGTEAGAESVTLAYGYDSLVGKSTVVGLSGSFTEVDIDAERNSIASTALEVAQVGAYAGHQLGQASFIAKASYTTGTADSQRQAFETIESEVDIEGLNLQTAASYNVSLGHGFYAKPQVDVEYTNLSTSAFTENGGLDLNIDSTNTNVLEGRVGLTVGSRKAISDTKRADFFVTGAVRNDFYGVRDDIGFAFAGQSGTLGVTNPGSFAVQGSAGLNIVSGENFSFGGAVNSEMSDQLNSVGGSVKTKFKF